MRDVGGTKTWEDVAKTVSTDASTAAQGGDLGWIQAESSQEDEAFSDALFAAEIDTPTAVVEGEDGILRIGRVTEIDAETVDDLYTDKLVNDGVELAKYRTVVRSDAIREKLEEKVVADATKPGPQREVSQIYLSTETADLPEDAVKVRHILYSPKDDPAGAQGGTIPPADPSWAKAKADADAAYAKLQADPTQFDAIARAESDEESARGPTGSGGELGAYVSADSSYVPTFSGPILEAKPTDGQILAPIKTEFGYHIVQVLNHAPDLGRAQDAGGRRRRLREARPRLLGRPGGEPRRRPRLGRPGPAREGARDGHLRDRARQDLGRGHGRRRRQRTCSRSRKEEERTPEGRQLEEIRVRAFADWYQPKKDAVVVERDPRHPERRGRLGTAPCSTRS